MTSLTLVIGNKNYSSWSLRPWLAIKQAGLTFDEIRIPLCQTGSAEEIRKYSPAGKVPILLHGSITVWDSMAICNYLAEQFPGLAWWPRKQNARAIARSISAEMHSGFMALRQHMPMNIRASLLGQGHLPEVMIDIERVKQIWVSCREQFQDDGDFLCGPFSIADAMYAPVVFRFLTYGVTLDHTCQAYVDSMLALPALQEWIAAGKAETEVIEFV